MTVSMDFVKTNRKNYETMYSINIMKVQLTINYLRNWVARGPQLTDSADNPYNSRK